MARGLGSLMVNACRYAFLTLEKYQGWRGVLSQLTEESKPVERDDNLFDPMLRTQTVRGKYGITREHLATVPRKHLFKPPWRC